MTQTKPYDSIQSLGDSIGDTIASHIDLAFRRIMPGIGVEIEPGFVRLLTGELHPFGNFSCVCHPVNTETTARAIEPLHQISAPSAVFLTGAVPDAVEAQLSQAGFVRHGGMPCMGVEIDSIPETQLPPGFTFERVSDESKREEWANVFARGYELPPRVGAAFAGGIDGDDRPDAPLQYFWIRNGDTPVCTSLIYMHEGLAGIYGVATLREARGKGLGAFVTAQPLRIARELGYRVGVLQASEDGHPVYRRIGFQDFGEVPLYVRMPS